MLILGVDPGAQRTGIAHIFAPEEDLKLVSAYEIEGGTQGFIDNGSADISLFQFDLIVVEDYVVHRAQGDPRGLEIIGILKYLGNKYGVPVKVQPAAGRKKAVPDEVLKRLGMYEGGDANRNSREAVRHVIWHLYEQAHIPTLMKGYTSKPDGGVGGSPG